MPARGLFKLSRVLSCLLTTKTTKTEDWEAGAALVRQELSEAGAEQLIAFYDSFYPGGNLSEMNTTRVAKSTTCYPFERH